MTLGKLLQNALSKGTLREWISRALSLALLTCAVANGQTPAGADPGVDNLAARIATLERKLQETERLLEVRSDQLGAAVDRLERIESRLALAESGQTAAAAAEPDIPVNIEPQKALASVTSQHDHMSLPMESGAPKLNIRGFGDVNYSPSGLSEPTTGPRSFTLGQLDLFITSRISDHLSALVETVFEADRSNGLGVDLERYLLQYRQSRYLKIDAGRNHSAIGYYNTEFHHGSWFQTAVGRPFLFAFEDKGGPLPIHNVGLRASGEIPSGHLGLEYVAEVGNSRSYEPGSEPVQNFRNTGGGRSTNFAISASPDALHGIRAGASFYRVVLTPGNLIPIEQRIYAGYLVYRQDRVEFLNEAVWMRHTQDFGSGMTRQTSIPGGYAQFAYRFGPLRPYLRYEYLNPSLSDPIARLVLPSVGLRREFSGGVRYDFDEFAALKFQLGRLSQRYGPSGNIGTVQLAFTF
jgi:hypothetical protein